MRFRNLKLLMLTAVAAFAVVTGVCAADSGEVERLRRENAELREQLLRERTRLRDQALFLASVADAGEFSTPKEREARLLTKLAALCADGDKFAVKAAEVVAEIRGALRELPMEASRRAQLNLLLDELERQAGAFAALVGGPASDPGAALRSCRVLAVNRELGILLMDVGFRQGAFVGMILRGGEDNKLEIRLEDVRSGVSAATMRSGELRSVVPGMVFNAETRVRR